MSSSKPFDSIVHGYAAAAYFGGRAEVRVRCTEVPVLVADVTSMYPTVFNLQDLQGLLASQRLFVRDVTDDTRHLVEDLEPDQLFDPAIWPRFNRLVLVEPNGEILPVRMRYTSEEPYTISVTHLTSSHARWYALADVIGAKLGGKAPKIIRALEIYGENAKNLRTVRFRNELDINPRTDSVFKSIVEQRQVAKAAKKKGGHTDAARLDQALKLFANSGAYGIFAEINVTPSPKKQLKSGHVYSDTDYYWPVVHDERPGSFANFALASLVTGGARLILSLLEYLVSKAGGTFAFCDTDSLAIVCGEDCPEDIPHLKESEVLAILEQFNSLNTYDRENVPHLLKREYSDAANLRCFAISAKRYVLFERTADRIAIVKASESGLGAILGRTDKENTKKLARRIWLRILSIELPMNERQLKRVNSLTNFDVPLRRKLPLSQPATYDRPGFRRYNKNREYDMQVKPYNFLQAMTVAQQEADENLQPVAPFERDLMKCQELPWTDYETGLPLSIDWHNTYHAGTIAVLRLSEYVERYRKHPEAKAGDADGNPATAETRGLLHRLHLEASEPAHLGKEVDRLDEDEGTTLDADGPIVYKRSAGEDATLKAASEFLARFPQRQVASELAISERRWRDIVKGRAIPHRRTAAKILRLARKYRM